MSKESRIKLVMLMSGLAGVSGGAAVESTINTFVAGKSEWFFIPLTLIGFLAAAMCAAGNAAALVYKEETKNQSVKLTNPAKIIPGEPWFHYYSKWPEYREYHIPLPSGNEAVIRYWNRGDWIGIETHEFFGKVERPTTLDDMLHVARFFQQLKMEHDHPQGIFSKSNEVVE